ncbi:DUF4185 domain-containing protein [Promicromonospora panici]|uniref:DUF4185 domain-containing protein n=1 Tax=Promicromonospora panici TaxID=2219658 RepID=UPI00101D96D8|nr:DUF4185 domain-containing protein [Promicromonospora panici]
MARRLGRTALVVAPAVGALSLVAGVGSTAVAGPDGADGLDSRDEGFVLTDVTDVERVGQITGAEGPGDTTQYSVNFTDLGSMFEADGKVWFAFGDTFGERDDDMTGGGGSLWRSNTLGWTTDADPSDGITIEGMILDDAGVAKELLASKKVDGDEITVIPTHGFATDAGMYLHYMSVRQWGTPGEWEVNHAGLAKSTDEGQTWEKLDAPRWGGESGFVQISPAHVTVGGRDWLYVWGVTHGRFGGVSLARVPAAQVEDPAAWQYFAGLADGGAGSGADAAPRWAADPVDAALVLDDTVGELSVVWNDHLDRWIMTYLAEGRGIVLREGLSPWGPWGEPFELVGATEVPGPYAPYMLPRYTEDGGRTIYFALSIWDPYNVFWYRAELARD